MGTHRWRNFFYQRKSRNPSAAVFMGGGELLFERKQATTRKSKRMVKDPQNQIAISVSTFRGSVFFFLDAAVLFFLQNRICLGQQSHRQKRSGGTTERDTFAFEGETETEKQVLSGLFWEKQLLGQKRVLTNKNMF